MSRQTAAASATASGGDVAPGALRAHAAIGHGPHAASAEGAVNLPVITAPAGIAAELIHDDEVVILLLRPSLLFIPLASLGSLMVIAIITLALMWLARLPQAAPWIGFTDRQALSMGAALTVIRLGWQALDWWSRIYVLTDRRVIRRMGVLSVSIFQTQLRNLQHTSVFVRVRERIFGLGSIGFATAGSSTFEAFWVMIPKPFQVHRIIVQAIQKYGR